MLSFFRRIFGPFPARFSDDVRAVTAYSQTLAVKCGAPKISTAHMLAAVARHPKGDQILAGHAKGVFLTVCGEKPSETPTPIPPKGRLESEEEFKALIQRLAKDALSAPKRSVARTIELHDIVRVLASMPQSKAYPVLKQFGLAPGESAAG
jgi:ATP-dependent Clp protease ATP-binding subunit ClpA